MFGTRARNFITTGGFIMAIGEKYMLRGGMVPRWLQASSYSAGDMVYLDSDSIVYSANSDIAGGVAFVAGKGVNQWGYASAALWSLDEFNVAGDVRVHHNDMFMANGTNIQGTAFVEGTGLTSWTRLHEALEPAADSIVYSHLDSFRPQSITNILTEPWVWLSGTGYSIVVGDKITEPFGKWTVAAGNWLIQFWETGTTNDSLYMPEIYIDGAAVVRGYISTASSPGMQTGYIEHRMRTYSTVDVQAGDAAVGAGRAISTNNKATRVRIIELAE
jgi:hypothetical protein